MCLKSESHWPSKTSHRSILTYFVHTSSGILQHKHHPVDITSYRLNMFTCLRINPTLFPPHLFSLLISSHVFVLSYCTTATSLGSWERMQSSSTHFCTVAPADSLSEQIRHWWLLMWRIAKKTASFTCGYSYYHNLILQRTHHSEKNKPWCVSISETNWFCVKKKKKRNKTSSHAVIGKMILGWQYYFFCMAVIPSF